MEIRENNGNIKIMSQASRKEKKKKTIPVTTSLFYRNMSSPGKQEELCAKVNISCVFPVQTGAHAGHKVVTDGYLL